MKVKVEQTVNVKEVVDISVNEGLEVLFNAITQEAYETSGGCCEQAENGMVCCRGKNHEGIHIATGIEKVYCAWEND
jgi:hypothetical protein